MSDAIKNGIKINYSLKFVKTDINSTTSFEGQSSKKSWYAGRYIISNNKEVTVI